jgi:hypothetical protein
MFTSTKKTVAISLAALAVGLALAGSVTPAAAGYYHGGGYGGYHGGYGGYHGGYGYGYGHGYGYGGYRSYGYGGYTGYGYGGYHNYGYGNYGVGYAPAPVVVVPAPAPVVEVPAPAPDCNVAYHPVYDQDGNIVGQRPVNSCQ